jgi:tetratricopeptide (TPR) repeat protein
VPREWNLACSRLERAKLLTVNRSPAGSLLSLDAHPLLREYFARELRTHQPAALRAAHRRLYKHLCATTKDVPQPTLEDLQPLYQAIAHGCHAGMQQKACDDVYYGRIQRGSEFYSARKLGAFGADLGAIACFFEQPCRRLSPTLSQADQAWLLNEVASRLRGVGRLTEALEPMRAALEVGAAMRQWKACAARAQNLSELELALGEVVNAVRDAEQSVTYADDSGDGFQRVVNRARLAYAQYQAGGRAKAEAGFRDAEAMQAKRQPQFPLCYSVGGFLYCEVLLAGAERAAWARLATVSRSRDPAASGDGEHGADVGAAIQSCRAVFQRAAQTLEWAEQYGSLLSVALDHLSLGRAALYLAVLESSSAEVATASSHITAAVDGLRRASRQDYLALGLLTHAWLSFLTGPAGIESAQADLDEAWEIAERGPMPLVLADIHLHRARLSHGVTPYLWAADADGRARGPRDNLAAARCLIEKYGHWRRKEELEDAESAATRW